MGGCVGRFINQKKWILLSDHDRTDCTRWLHTNTINSKRAAYTSTVNQDSDNFMVALNTLAFTHGSGVCHRIGQEISKNVPKPIYTIKSLLNWCYTPYSWHLAYLPLPKQTGQQLAFILNSWLLFSHQRCTISEITHDLSTDGVALLVWCHSKSLSNPIPTNNVTGRIDSSTGPSLSTAFPPQA